MASVKMHLDDACRSRIRNDMHVVNQNWQGHEAKCLAWHEPDQFRVYLVSLVYSAEEK